MLRLERAYNYVREAFAPYPLPQPPATDASKAERNKYRHDNEKALQMHQTFRDRRFLILKATGASLATASVGGFVAAQRILTPDVPTPVVTRRATQEPQETPLTLTELREIASNSIDGINTVLGLSFDKAEYVNRIILASTIEEFNTYKNPSRGRLSREQLLENAAMTTLDGRIVINKESIDYYMRNYKTEVSSRNIFIDEVITHEILHAVTPHYISEPLHNITYNGSYANSAALAGHTARHEFVDGARIIGIRDDGERVMLYELLEEAETYTLSNYVMSKKGNSKLLTPIVQAYPVQTYMVESLLIKTYGERDQGMRALAAFRAMPQGREAYVEYLANRFTGSRENAFDFMIDLFRAIETENHDRFNALTST